MNKSDYLIFRHTLGKNPYRVPIDYSKNKIKKISKVKVKEQLVESLKDLKDFTCFVSGGVDSSLLAAIAKPKVIYTASFPGYENDESQWAQKVADHIGAELRIIEITKNEYLATLEKLIWLKGDGLHPNEPCLYLVAKQAVKDGFSTILSGEGADDIFGGYTDLLDNGEKYLENKESFLSRYAYVRPSKYGLPEEIPFDDFKKWAMERFILEIHTVGLISRAVYACVAAGITPKFPYLEGKLPQMMWQAPKDKKVNKKLLKELAEEYLPHEVVYRPKIGFPVPLSEWVGQKGIEDFLLLNIKIWESFN